MLVDRFKKLSFRQHLSVSIILRLSLILYGSIQDEILKVPYTDIDYNVVTDGSRYMLQNESPYRRSTYRYSPLLAALLIPNIVIHHCYGKLLFSFFDLFVGVLIKTIVRDELMVTFTENFKAVARKHDLKKKKSNTVVQLPDHYKQLSKYSSLLWLYNPLTMVIATRGNGDSLTSFLVLATIYFLTKSRQNSMIYAFLAGLLHGLAIHFRLYPLIFSFCYYLYLTTNRKNALQIFLPNLKQLLLIFGTLISFGYFTIIFYRLYGDEFLYETYFYHLKRTDVRHNFSVFFYMQYLQSMQQTIFLQKLLTILPQFTILIFTAFKFAIHYKTFAFALFVQSFIMVTFNSVVTSQYFVWFLSLLPLCAKNFRKIPLKSLIFYIFLWFFTQGAWLFPAYLLEFKGWNTFSMIWMQGVVFFCSNVYIIQCLIKGFDVISDFGKHS